MRGFGQENLKMAGISGLIYYGPELGATKPM